MRIRGRQNEPDIRRGYISVRSQQDEAFHDVAQFPDISGPAVLPQFVDGFGSKDFILPAVLRRDLARKMRYQFRKISLALVQGRQRQRKDINPVKEIAAESVLL